MAQWLLALVKFVEYMLINGRADASSLKIRMYIDAKIDPAWFIRPRSLAIIGEGDDLSFFFNHYSLEEIGGAARGIGMLKISYRVEVIRPYGNFYGGDSLIFLVGVGLSRSRVVL